MKIGKKILFPTLIAVAFAAFAVFFFVSGTVQADGVSAALKTEYEYGETVDVPQGEITYGGVSTAAESHAVIFPDGSVSRDNAVLIEDYGKYTVRYYATVSGRKVYGDKAFTVKNTLCSSVNSSYYYGVNENYKTGKGLSVSVKAGDELRVNKVVDLASIGYDYPFINFQFTPDNFGIADAYRVYMKLTDAYDEDNYIIVRMQNWSDFGSWADSQCYMDAKAPNQEWTTCIEKNDNHHKRGEEGKGWYCTRNSMTGRGADGKATYDTLRFFFDNDNLILKPQGSRAGF